MHHFFVSPQQVEEEYIFIRGGDVNHIKNVLRMKTGERLLLSDGLGNDYLCRITEITEGYVKAKRTDDTFEGTELPAKIYLFQALPKGDKMDMIIQKAVELGAYAIIPVRTSRCIVKLDEKKAKAKQKRWSMIAESAAKQSRRSIIPEVMPVLDFAEALAMIHDFDMNLIPYENNKDMEQTKQILHRIRQYPIENIGIFIGPEGGFTEEEVQKAMEQNIQPITLGKRILRTETAGMAMLSILMFQLEQ